MHSPIEIFFSYAHEDEDLMNDVRRQLIVHERNGRILKWHDREITPGADWRQHIDWRLEHAAIILLFLSPHFIESKYCYEVEGKEALRRHETGQARVIPIILRPCLWEASPFGKLQALPRDAKPVTRWPDRDEACLDVAKGVMSAVDEVVVIREGRRDIPGVGLPKNTVSGTPGGSHDSAVDGRARLIYCSRCGQVTGRQTTCTGTHTHHAFTTGSTHDYCSRCGVRPGSPSTCTGTYTHHSFKRGSGPAHYSRCGAPVGAQSTCTGTYMHHDFVSDNELTA